MDADAQEQTLGCLFAHPDQSAGFIAEHFTPEMFTAANAAIFAAFQRAFIAGEDSSIMGIARSMKAAGTLDASGGASHLFDMQAKAALPIALPELAKSLRDALARQRLATAFTELGKAVAAPNPDIGGILSESLSRIEAIAHGREKHGAVPTKEIVMQALRNIESRCTGTGRGVSTGIESLDRVTGGVRPSSQWIVAGPAKGGKSSLAITILASLAVRQGKRCAFFGLEMPSVENMERLLAHNGRVPASVLRDGLVNEAGMNSLMHSSGRLAAAPWYFRDDIFELVELLSCIRQLRSSYPDLFAVFVDYAQLVGNVDEDHREREVASVSRALRKISMTTGLAIFLLSQTNDDGLLRESRTLGMDATKILTIELTDNPRVRMLKIIQRDGISGVNLKCAYNGEFFEFATLSEYPEDSETEPEPPKKKRWKKYHQ